MDTVVRTAAVYVFLPFMLAEFAIMFLMVLFPPLVMVPATWFSG